jgi:Uma2 family endonuclease
MQNPSLSVRLTYRDILALPDDLLRHELIDGEHIVSPAPILAHQRVVGNLYFHLRIYLERHPVGVALLSPLDVLLSEHDMVEPDLIYISEDRKRRQLNAKRLVGPPDLAVEVLSPATRRLDETRKLRLYESFGVSEYWLIAPDEETVRVYRMKGKSLVLADRLPRSGAPAAGSPGSGSPRSVAPGPRLAMSAPGRPLTTPLLPGLALPMTKLFAP